MLRGIATVIIIAIIAGIIAYIGDRVGHQVGRKRLTIFNIRPRYTSTIIAVATGMIIALFITLIAIFASNQVQTAFFRLNEINAEIAKAQARAQELEQRVNYSPVVVNLDALMSPSVGNIPVTAPAGLRHDIVRQFYDQTVSYINQQYTRPPYNLKRFVPPENVDKILDGLTNQPAVQAWLTQSNVLLIATASQNLYPHDQIHFGITPVQDKVIAPAGQAIASILIPAGKNANAQIALAELLGPSGYVPREMVRHGLLPYFAGNVLVQRTLPAVQQMQKTLTSTSGNYLMTAFASSDIYVHTFGVPVVVTLQRAPAQ